MPYQRDPDGLYTIRFSNRPDDFYRTHLTPTDSTTIETWAESLIQAGQDAIDHGFGLCHDGTPYDLLNFLCDTHGGNVPWDPVRFNQLYETMQAHPKFHQVMNDFYTKYDTLYFGRTKEEHDDPGL